MKQSPSACTPQTHFDTFYYHHLKEPATEYITRTLYGGASGLMIEDLEKMAPWDYQSALEAQIGDVTLRPVEAIKGEIALHAERFQLLSCSITNLHIRAFAQQMELAAFLTCLHKKYIETKTITVKALYEKLGISVSTGQRLRRVYTFVCKYNLVLYTGVSYTLLLHWIDELETFFIDTPSEALFFTGGTMLRGKPHQRTFIFNERRVAHHELNLQERKESISRVENNKKKADEERAQEHVDQMALEDDDEEGLSADRPEGHKEDESADNSTDLPQQVNNITLTQGQNPSPSNPKDMTLI